MTLLIVQKDAVYSFEESYVGAVSADLPIETNSKFDSNNLITDSETIVAFLAVRVTINNDLGLCAGKETRDECI